MATAPIEQQPDAQSEAPPVDFEVEAKKMGWSPLEDFKGDAKHHIDAETFYTRAIEYMPVAKATIKTLSKRLDDAERNAKRAAEFFSAGEQRAYERALAEIRAEQEAAVESGDLVAHRAAAAKLDKLEKPDASSPPADETDRAEEFADWGRANKWYASNEIMRVYADAQGSKIMKPGKFLEKADLDEVAARVRAKFPEEFETAEDRQPARRSPVAGGNTTPPRGGGKSYNDLPDEAKRMCDKWIKGGLIKDRETYVKSYKF